MSVVCVVCKGRYDAGGVYKDYDGVEGGRCLCIRCHEKQPTIPESFQNVWTDDALQPVVTETVDVREFPDAGG